MSKPLIKLPTETLTALLKNSLESYGEKLAMRIVDGESLSYAAFGEKVKEVQSMLQSYGVRKGDRVAIYSTNMPNWPVVYFAVTTMGAVIVPILPDFHTNEAMHIANHAECKAAFVSQKLFDTMLDEIQPPHMNLLVILDELKILEQLSKRTTVEKAMQKGGEHFAKAMGKFTQESSEVSENDLAAIIYTSGTTGSSKGVMLTHKNLVFDALSGQHIVDIFPEDRFLSILPLAHTYECTVGMIIPILNGASIHYITKPPTPTVLIKAMAVVKPTFMLSVPLVIEKIYKNKVQPNFQKNLIIRGLYALPFIRKQLNKIAGQKLLETFGGSIRFFGIGGGGVSPQVEAFLREAKFPYCIGYGLTETAPLLAGTNPDNTKYKAIGPMIQGIEAELRNTNSDGSGTLWVKGPNIMKGYYKDPEKTAEVFDEEGWFNTEDIGYFDKDGYFFMSGRAKNIIVGASGENIYPEQVEAAINAHELVADSLVFDDNGTLAARIYLDPEKVEAYFHTSSLSETKTHDKIEGILEEIRIGVNENVSSFSRIRKVIEQREEFVKTPTKKIKRYLYVEAKKK